MGPELHANERNCLVVDANVNWQTTSIEFHLIEGTTRCSIAFKLSKCMQCIASRDWLASDIVVVSTNTLHPFESPTANLNCQARGMRCSACSHAGRSSCRLAFPLDFPRTNRGHKCIYRYLRSPLAHPEVSKRRPSKCLGWIRQSVGSILGKHTPWLGYSLKRQSSVLSLRWKPAIGRGSNTKTHQRFDSLKQQLKALVSQCRTAYFLFELVYLSLRYSFSDADSDQDLHENREFESVFANSLGSS